MGWKRRWDLQHCGYKRFRRKLDLTSLRLMPHESGCSEISCRDKSFEEMGERLDVTDPIVEINRWRDAASVPALRFKRQKKANHI
jgi:hypothetical protein